jgi:hypothetical protein
LVNMMSLRPLNFGKDMAHHGTSENMNKWLLTFF